jgi:hypothetical protein
MSSKTARTSAKKAKPAKEEAPTQAPKPSRKASPKAKPDDSSSVSKTPRTSTKKAKPKEEKAKPKDTEPKKAEPQKPKVVKDEAKAAEAETKKSKRKINMNPTLAEKAGLNISVARVKNIVDTFILNKAEYDASREVREAHNPPSKDAEGKVVKDAEGKVVSLASVPISSLSLETQALIQKAKRFHDRAQKEEWEKTAISKMSADVKEKYQAARRAAKDAFEDSMRCVPEFERGSFDLEAFNVSHNKNFYKGFVEAKAAEDEWSVALSQLSKLRVRFSSNSKILLSAFIELILRQLATNGTLNCVKRKKKIIKLSHALDNTDDPQFSLYSVITNTKTYKKYLASRPKESEAEDEKDEAEDSAPEPDESVDGPDSRPNFRFYVSEICRDARMRLASGDDAADNVYNLTNVSRDFKDFCNDLIFEVVGTLGRMILTEINTRGVKTLNDVIMKTVIEHLHSAYSIDFRSSLQFIEQATTKYITFVKNRRETRKSDDSGKKADEYDVEYEEE